MIRRLKDIKVLSLDAMHTIITLKEEPGEVYSRFMNNHFGIKVEPEILNTNFNKSFCFMEQNYPCYAFKQNDPDFWWCQVIKNTFPENLLKEKDMEKLAMNLIEYYSTSEPWHLMENNLDHTLQLIKEMNISIVVVSNFDYRLRKILANFHLSPLIDHFFLSSELGVEKPSFEIFQKILNFTKIKNHKQILHIGDSLEKDVNGARRFGAQALLYSKELITSKEIPQIRCLFDLI